MKVFLYLLFTSIACYACSVEPEKILVEVPALSASDIYYTSAVKKYMLQYGDTHKDIGASYVNKAVAIKDKDVKKAIYFYKRAITLNPTKEAYTALIELLSATKNYEEAYRAYNVLVSEAYYEVNGKQERAYVFDVPDENTLIDYVIMGVLANDRVDYYDLSMIGEDVDKQKIRARLVADERFDYDTSSIAYKNIMLQFWSEDEINSYKKSLVNLNALLASVHDTSIVFEINKKNVNLFRYDDFNGMNYSEEFEDGGMLLTDMVVYYLKEKQDNPDKWFRYNVTHSFHPQDSLTALVYAVDTSATACPIEMRHIYHHLVIYDVTGKIISDKIIAFQSAENLQTVSFNKDHFEVTEYKRTWKNPYGKYDFDNEIIKTDLISKKTYLIAANGAITESVLIP